MHNTADDPGARSLTDLHSAKDLSKAETMLQHFNQPTVSSNDKQAHPQRYAASIEGATSDLAQDTNLKARFPLDPKLNFTADNHALPIAEVSQNPKVILGVGGFVFHGGDLEQIYDSGQGFG
jgi:hypothetical protein